RRTETLRQHPGGRGPGSPRARRRPRHHLSRRGAPSPFGSHCATRRWRPTRVRGGPVRESDFIVRPEHFLRYLRESLGLRRAETHLPRIGIIVFSSSDFRGLHQSVDGQRKGWNRWLSVGKAGRKSVVVARSPIGAPAAIITMEEMTALGCRTILTFGACGSLVPDLVIGDLVLPTFA